MAEFRMPSLGADMEAGTLIEWLRQPGDPVKRGDIVAVVETQKGAIEVEIFEDGIVDRLLIEPGAKVPVGTALALIRGAAEAPHAVPPTAPGPERMPSPVPTRAGPPVMSAPAARPRASPAARRIAATRGIDLGAIAGSGPDGAIISTDLGRAPVTRSRGPDLAAMRKAIAAAMSRSKREIPHYYLSHMINLTRSLAWLAEMNAARPPQTRFLPAVMLLKASAQALREYPDFNGVFLDGQYQPAEHIHIGMAIAIRGGGLTAPAIHDVDRLTLDELMARLRDLVARTRAGTLRSSELTDATITVTSLGERGVDTLLGVIYPPQVAILGFGTPATRPWVVGERIEERQIMMASLAADHRVSDGHRGALLLAAIDHNLQQPEAL